MTNMKHSPFIDIAKCIITKYIYIYRERERERKRKKERERGRVP